MVILEAVFYRKYLGLFLCCNLIRSDKSKDDEYHYVTLKGVEGIEDLTVSYKIFQLPFNIKKEKHFILQCRRP